MSTILYPCQSGDQKNAFGERKTCCCVQ